MLSLFPEILFLAPFSAFALRISLAAVLAYGAWKHVTESAYLSRAWAFVEIVAAAALFSGAWTQAAALFAAVWLFAGLFVRDMRTLPKSAVLLATIIALSLAVTGPGPFSFDLPL